MKAASDVTAERNKNKDSYPGCSGGTGPPGTLATTASQSCDDRTANNSSEAHASEDPGKCLCRSEGSSENGSEESSFCTRCSCYTSQSQQRRTNGVSDDECPSTSSTCGMNGPNVGGAELSLRTLPACGSSGETSNERTSERISATDNEQQNTTCEQQGRYEMEYDFPCRPVTRARSRLSRVPLISQSGMIAFA